MRSDKTSKYARYDGSVLRKVDDALSIETMTSGIGGYECPYLMGEHICQKPEIARDRLWVNPQTRSRSVSLFQHIFSGLQHSFALRVRIFSVRMFSSFHRIFSVHYKNTSICMQNRHGLLYFCHVAQLTLLHTFLPQVNGSIPNIAPFFCCTGLALSTELCYMQHRNLACINSCFSSALASAKIRVCRGSLFFLFALILTSIPSSPY